MPQGRVLSGIQPTGRLHIGNYLGAVRNYVKLQDDYECLYCIVDLHALTTLGSEVRRLADDTREMAVDLLAAGLDPQRGTILFVQSHVPQVPELHLLLSMVTPLGRLLRLPTFKEKARQQPDNVNYGLVGYPVLQTADIIIYKADAVPVGEDQLPHLELAREIARRFNSLFGDTFPLPYAKLTDFPRVLGLDGVQKMSKSLNNHIELAASPEETGQRVMTAFTDPAKIRRGDPGHPEICNVFTLHGFFSPQDRPGIERDCRSGALGCVDCKRLLARHINASLAGFRDRRAEIAAQPRSVEEVLADGAARAQAIADATLQEVKDRMGLLPRTAARAASE